ncbi:MAG TPA: caspase family protein, partial [Chitinophagales bacterium]|nr:caspase family protein [Chitinophagales bacterium]
MAKKVFALLLGIDNYPTSPLDGCVHDSEIMEEYLRTIIPADQLVLQTLRNDKATKSNVIDGFLQHLAQAKQDDMVFLHYAGHGSREQADQMFWQIEPDRQNEVMVLYDSI